MKHNIQKAFVVIFMLFTVCFVNLSVADTKNQAACPKDEAKITYLYVQTAKSGSLIYNKESSAYKLTLYNIDPWIIYFSKVPNQESGFVYATDFVNNMKKDIAEKYPNGLNSGLTVFENDDGSKASKYTVILKDPVYDKKTQTMSFTAKIMKGDKVTIFLNKLIFKHAALFIDDMDNSAGGGGSW